MMEKLSIFFIFHEFFTEFIFIFRVVYAEHIFLFTKLYRGENQKVFLYITVTNIKGDFFAIFNFKKNIVYRREPKTKKKLEGEIFKSFFRDTFSHILSDSNSMYVYVLTTCSMIFLNVKTEHSKIIYLDSCSLLD